MATGLQRANDLWAQLPMTIDIKNPSEYAAKLRMFAQNICAQLEYLRGTFSASSEYLTTTTNAFPTSLGGLLYAKSDGIGAGAVGITGQAAISGGPGAPMWFSGTPGGLLWASGAGGILASSPAGVSGQVPISGGTGSPNWFASGTQGGIAYFNANSVLASSGAGSSGQVILSGGTGAPTFETKGSANVASTIMERDANGDFGSRHALLDGGVRLGSTAPSGLSSGQAAVYLDNTQHTEAFATDLYLTRRRGILFMQAGQGVCNNTTTETSIIQQTGAIGTLITTNNVFVPGRTLEIEVAGTITTDSTYAGESLVVALKSTNHGTLQVNTTVALAVTAGVRTVTPGAMTNIVVGSSLYIDGAGTPEIVRVTAIDAGLGTFTATFGLNHLAGFTVVDQSIWQWELNAGLAASMILNPYNMKFLLSFQSATEVFIQSQFRLKNNGSSGAVTSDAIASLQKWTPAVNPTPATIATVSTIGWDTTVGESFDLTATWGVALAGNTITTDFLSFEVLT